MTAQQQTAWRGLVGSLALTMLLGLAVVGGCAKEQVPPPPAWIVIGYTGSMFPTFKGGETFVPKQTPFADLKAGMIVLTYFGGDWHPHRLVSRFLGRWTTKGDANSVADPHPMTEENYGGTISK